MATNREILELVLSIVGQDKYDELTAKLKKTGKAAQEAKVDIYDFSDAYEVVEREATKAAASIQKVEVAEKAATVTTKAATAAKRENAEASKAHGQGAMQVAFAVQDLASANGDLVQSLYRVQNNIPLLLTSLGMSGGWAGAISLVSLGIGFLLPKIQEWARGMGILDDAFTAAGGGLKGLQARITELEGKKILIPVETIELDNAKAKLAELQKDLETFKATQEGKTPFQKRAGERVAAAIAESGLEPELNARLKGQYLAEQLASSPAIKAVGAAEQKYQVAEARFQSGTGGQFARENRDSAFDALQAARAAASAARTKLEMQSEAAAGGLIGRAQSGKDQQSQERLAERLERLAANEPDPGKRVKYLTLARGIRMATPGSMEAEELTKAGAELTGPALAELAESNRGRIILNQHEGSHDPLIHAAAKKAHETLQQDFVAQKGEHFAHAGRQFDTDRANEAGAAETAAALPALERAKGEIALAKQAAHTHVGEQLRKEDESIAAHGLVQMAESMIADLKAGRDVGNNRMSDAQIMDAVNRQVQGYLTRQVGTDQRGRAIRANPGMDAETRENIASKVVGEAQISLGHDMVGLSASNASNTAKLISIAQMQAAEVARLRAETNQMATSIDGLVRSSRPQARTGRNRGS